MRFPRFIRERDDKKFPSTIFEDIRNGNTDKLRSMKIGTEVEEILDMYLQDINDIKKP